MRAPRPPKPPTEDELRRGPPEAWQETIVAPPREWQIFWRSGGLADRLAQADADLDAARADATRRVQRLDALVRRLARVSEGFSVFDVVATLYPLAAATANEAKRTAGCDPDDLLRDGLPHAERGVYAFDSARSALLGVSAEPARLGLGSARLDVALDRPEHKRERARAVARGRQRPLSIDEHGRVTEAAGYLPANFRRCVQTRSGAVGCKNDRDIDRTQDVEAACARARRHIDPETWELLVAVEVGETRRHDYVGQPGAEKHAKCWCGVPLHAVVKGREFSGEKASTMLGSWVGRDRARVSVLATKLRTTPQELGHRLAEARRELHAELHLAGLVPPLPPKRARREPTPRARPGRDPVVMPVLPDYEPEGYEAAAE